MDELRTELKHAAADIDVGDTRSLQARIDASLVAEHEAKAILPPRPRPKRSLWLASSLSGLLAAAAVIAVINMGGAVDPIAPPTDVTAMTTVGEEPEYLPFMQQIPLRVESADLTSPLEQELNDLQSDLEKARAAVEDEVKFTF